MLNESERCLALRPFRSFVNYVKKELGVSKGTTFEVIDYFSILDQPYSDYLKNESKTDIIKTSIIEAPMSLEWPPNLPQCHLSFSFFFLNEIASNSDDAFNQDVLACMRDMKEKTQFQFIGVPCAPEEEDGVISIYSDFDQTWWGEKIAEVLNIETIETNSYGYFFGCRS